MRGQRRNDESRQSPARSPLAICHSLVGMDDQDRYDVIPLGPGWFDEAVKVLCEAFYDYPVMRFVIGPAGDDYDRRLRLLVGFFTASRLLRDYPVLGVASQEGRVVAVAGIDPAEGRSEPPALSELGRQLATELGQDAVERLEAFSASCQRHEPEVPHYNLGMIGVRRASAGQGHGRRLLEAVHEMSARDQASVGVGLTTEDPRNVALYERFGYEIVGEEDVGTIHTWVFFRPDGP